MVGKYKVIPLKIGNTAEIAVLMSCSIICNSEITAAVPRKEGRLSAYILVVRHKSIQVDFTLLDWDIDHKNVMANLTRMIKRYMTDKYISVNLKLLLSYHIHRFMNRA